MSIYVNVEVLETDMVDVKPWQTDSVCVFINSSWTSDHRSQYSIFATKEEWVDALNQAEDNYLAELHPSLYVNVADSQLSMERSVFDRLANDVNALALSS